MVWGEIQISMHITLTSMDKPPLKLEMVKNQIPLFYMDVIYGIDTGVGVGVGGMGLGVGVGGGGWGWGGVGGGVGGVS